MEEYIGLDVSMEETAVTIRRGGQRVWRGKCPSDPHCCMDEQVGNPSWIA
jgi:transposase